MNSLTLFAMTAKGIAVANALLSSYPGLVTTIVGARDRAVDEDGFDAIAALAADAGVRFLDRKQFVQATTTHALAVSWRWLLDTAPATLLVMHDSLLPRLRGFNPLVTALINGDTRVGVTLLHAAAEFDRGDIVAQAATDVAYPITIAQAIDRVAPLYAQLALQLGSHLSSGRALPATAQVEADATYSLWRDEDDYWMDWNLDAATARRFVDAVGAPYRGAATRIDGKVVRLLRVQEVGDVTIENRTPGKVLFLREGVPVVVCGSGLLALHDVRDDASGESVLPLRNFRTRFG